MESNRGKLMLVAPTPEDKAIPPAVFAATAEFVVTVVLVALAAVLFGCWLEMAGGGAEVVLWQRLLEAMVCW
eukprot:7333549-Ditylum_brightwellii.AAC.1